MGAAAVRNVIPVRVFIGGVNASAVIGSVAEDGRAAHRAAGHHVESAALHGLVAYDNAVPNVRSVRHYRAAAHRGGVARSSHRRSRTVNEPNAVDNRPLG